MGKYVVTYGQNLYDVALHIYGSIEGIVDLMMNNISLSFDNVLKAGDELIYTDDFVINKDVVAYFKTNAITPSNGERHIYFKSPTPPRLMEIHIASTRTSIGFLISGSGFIEIDWGDNTDLRTVQLSNETKELSHSFNSNVGERRKVRIYANKDIRIRKLDISNMEEADVYVLQPIYIERFVMKNTNMASQFISLLNGTFEMNLSGSTIDCLLPLLKQKELMNLDIRDIHCTEKVIDEYLIGLVKQYFGRRSCTVTMSVPPSGEYKEPQKDENLNYILTSGMEAVWVLTHEPSWNETGVWKFVINDTTYTYEQNN